MTYPSTLEHPQWGWSSDFSAALESDLDSLPWQRVFRDLKDTEDGVRVNQDENRQVGHFWLRDPATAPTMKQALDIGDTSSAVVDWIHKIQLGELLLDDAHPITDVIHIGMGGRVWDPNFSFKRSGIPRPEPSISRQCGCPYRGQSCDALERPFEQYTHLGAVQIGVYARDHDVV